MKRVFKGFVSITVILAVVVSTVCGASAADTGKYEYVDPDDYTWYYWWLRTEISDDYGYADSAGDLHWDAEPMCNSDPAGCCLGIRPAIHVDPDAVSLQADSVEFGSYPQSLISDDSLCSELEDEITSWQLLSERNTGNTEDGHKVYEYRYYTVVDYKGKRYGATSYSYEKSTDNLEDHIKWFEYKPIEWWVLDREKGTLLSRYVIDANNYRNETYWDSTDNFDYADESKTLYACDYESSDVRAFINNEFYNSAFSEDEKAAINATEIESTLFGRGGTVKLNDKVYLLSPKDPEFQLHLPGDREHGTKATDYAKEKGAGYRETVYLDSEEIISLYDIGRTRLRTLPLASLKEVVFQIIFYPVRILFLLVPFYGLFGFGGLTAPAGSIISFGKVVSYVFKNRNSSVKVYYDTNKCEYVCFYWDAYEYDPEYPRYNPIVLIECRGKSGLDI